MGPSEPDKSKADLGAGLNLFSPDLGISHPAGPPQHEGMSQAERAISSASTFLSGILAISASQYMGAPLKMINPEAYESWIAFTKQSFAVLVTTMTQWWAPTKIRVSGDETMRNQLYKMEDGSLKCNFPHRIVLMANHQLYTDWLYLWWVAYCNQMHGHVYIILKESLKNIPIIGQAAQFYNFIFLARNWEKDKSRFQEHLSKLKDPKDPMWLLIFPEGTNLSKETRESSRRWAEKSGLKDLKHLLLPRNTGLRFCLQELRKTTNWLYDCTIAYEGIPPGMFGQDIFTLRSSLFEGRPPKSVNMHWRRFRISDIPIDNPKAFDVWLRNRWTEKDHMLEHFVRHNCFPSEKPWEMPPGKAPKPAPRIETQVKTGSLEEFLQIFAPVTVFSMVLFLFYGASKGSLLQAMGGQDILGDLAGKNGLNGLIPNGAIPQIEGLLPALDAAKAAGKPPAKQVSAQKTPTKAQPAAAAASKVVAKASGAAGSKPTTVSKPPAAKATPQATKAKPQANGTAVKPTQSSSTAPRKLSNATAPNPAVRRASASAAPRKLSTATAPNFQPVNWKANSADGVPAAASKAPTAAQAKGAVAQKAAAAAAAAAKPAVQAKASAAQVKAAAMKRAAAEAQPPKLNK